MNAAYQNRNRIPAAANQRHLMHLAAVFRIQMKHLSEEKAAIRRLP